MALIGKPCPSIDGLKFIKGDAFDVPSSAGPTIIELWASWCGPCRMVFPHLSQMARKYRDRGLRVVGVSLEEDSPKLRSFVESQGGNMDYPVAVDPQNSARQLMAAAGMSGIPAAFVVGSDRRIMYAGHPTDPKFSDAVEQACTTAPAPAAAAPETPLPPVTASHDELAAKPVRELKHILDERGIRYEDLHEKEELVQRILERCRNTTYYK